MGFIIAIIVLVFVAKKMEWSIFRHPYLSTTYTLGWLSRLGGTLAYSGYAFFFSDGNVDAYVYYRYATKFTAYFKRLDFSPFTDESLYRNGELFYTNFVAYPTSFFQIITFDSLLGVYLLFSVVCYMGLILMLKAFLRNYGEMDIKKMATYVLLFPAVWFWTSTIGKDAFMFLGFGLLCTAFRPNNKINYLYLLSGIAVIYAFRPPAAYMAILSIAALFVFNLKDVLAVRAIKIGAGITMVIFILNYLSQQWGVESLDADSLSEFQESTQRNNNYGDGALEEKTGGLSSIPRGIVDVLARPFLWEVRNFSTLLSSLEITTLLLLLWSNRKSVSRFFKTALNKKISTFILAFITIYVVSAGLVMNNIGLIARHRAILFPFFILMAFSYSRKPVAPRKIRPLKQQ